MGRPCTVCAHLERSRIDVLLSRQVVNLSQIARDFDLKRDAVTNHRTQHLPDFLAAFTSSATAPVVGTLMAEYQRIYLVALDELARAQHGVLVDVGDDGKEHRKISSTAIARALDNVRKALDRITHLAADAAAEDDRPSGMANGELTVRIREQLDRVMSRQLTSPERTTTPTNPIDLVELPDGDEGGGPGGQGGGGEGASTSTIPGFRAELPEKSLGLLPVVRKTIEDDRLSTQIEPEPVHQPLLKVPNPRYPGSSAATTEERTAAGYPDIELTLDDLKSRPDLLAQLAERGDADDR